MSRKERGFHVENAPLGSVSKRKMHTPADYMRQGIVFFILSIISIAVAFANLPAPFAIAIPLLARLALGVGFLASAVSCWLAAKGLYLLHPLHFVLNAVQVLMCWGLCLWFAFGENQLDIPWKIISGVLFGFTAFILTLPLVMKIAFPGLLDQAFNAAELQQKRNIEKRD